MDQDQELENEEDEGDENTNLATMEIEEFDIKPEELEQIAVLYD
jgi:hypothetical protein